MSPYSVVIVGLAAVVLVDCGLVPSLSTEEINDADNMVEPPPNLLMLPRVSDQDRRKSKIPPHLRLKNFIKAMLQYDTNHDTSLKKKQLIFNLQATSKKELPLNSTNVYSAYNKSSNASLHNALTDEGTTVETKLEELSTVTEQQILNQQNSNDYDDNLTTTNESAETTTETPQILLEDIVGSIVHIPSIWASDKSHRFTHSIRHGYGIPPR